MEIILSGRSCRVAKCSSPGRRGKTRLFEPRHPSEGATSPPLPLLPPDPTRAGPRTGTPTTAAESSSHKGFIASRRLREARRTDPATLKNGIHQPTASSSAVAQHRTNSASGTSAPPREISRGLQGQVRVIRNSIMILPQVHLRKPCYDFYFL